MTRCDNRIHENSKAGIGSGGEGSFLADNGITFCHNLITNTRVRQMLFTGPERIDFYNNVCSNALNFTELASYNGVKGPRINMLHNYYRSADETDYKDFADPVQATLTYETCVGGCGSLYVPENHETVHLAGNIYEYRSSGNWIRPYTTQWPMTWDMNLDENGEFDTDLQKSSAFSMWTSSDYVTPSAQDMEDEVLDVVLADAGCRLPLSDPELDEYDQDLVDAVATGDRLFPELNDDTKNLVPGRAYDETPDHQANPVSPTQLSWKQNDETNYFKVFFGLASQNPLPQLGGVVQGVGEGNTATISL